MARKMNNVITINFRNDTLFAVKRDDGVCVAIKPICEALGIDWKSQYQRIKDDPVLNEGMVTVTIPSPGGSQETTLLRFDLINVCCFAVEDEANV